MTSDSNREVLDVLERLFHSVDDYDTPKEEHHAAKQEALAMLEKHDRNPMTTESLARLEDRKRQASPDPDVAAGTMMVSVLKPILVTALDPVEINLKQNDLMFYDPERPAILHDGKWWGGPALDQAIDRQWIRVTAEVVDPEAAAGYSYEHDG
jgi:hypothetical protein